MKFSLLKNNCPHKNKIFNSLYKSKNSLALKNFVSPNDNSTNIKPALAFYVI